MKRRDTLATTAVTLLALAGVVLPAGTAAAQTARDLVGTWMNVSNINIRADGSRVDTFGSNSKGMIVFGNDGRYSSITLSANLPKFASSASSRTCVHSLAYLENSKITGGTS